MDVYKNHCMKNYSNMKIGGIAKKYIEVDSKDEVLELLKKEENIFILGNGTNTLLNDTTLNRVFITLKKIDYIKKIEDEIEVGAGLDFSKFIDYMEENDYTGLENLAGIPGSVGGLVFMNGGAFGTEIFDKISSVEIIDENNVIRKIKKENINFSYRTTEIKKKKWIVLSATFKLERGFQKNIANERKQKREDRHPLNDGNLGSTFKNPEGFYAAKLIMEAGLQGKKIGDAEVSTVHPNFVVNKGNAKFNEIIELIEEVKKEVKNKTGVQLEEEIIILNN